jgi:hypothetical protein
MIFLHGGIACGVVLLFGNLVPGDQQCSLTLSIYNKQRISYL